MITPRTTRLVRVSGLRAFRDAVMTCACAGTPFEVRDCLVIVPTRAAAAHLVRSIENRLPAGQGAQALPDLITPGELTARLAERLAIAHARLGDAEREALLGVACRNARAQGHEPPFRLRPGLIAEILRFYDALRRNQKDVATFERLALGALEPGAAIDRGAERLVRQTRFLAGALREFERLCAESGAMDEHGLRVAVLATAATRPWRHVVVAVGDRARDPRGLAPGDWDLLSRVPGLERLDVVVTNTTLAGAFHERVHQLLPGIEEVHVADSAHRADPALVIPPGSGLAHVARDREEEVAGFARWVKELVRDAEATELDRVALVVGQSLPYVYLVREVMRSAGVPCQMFDALPLAGEPYAAALDLVFSFVSSNFARIPSIALLRSPHFRFEIEEAGLKPGTTSDGARLEPGTTDDGATYDVASLDRALSEAGYLGDLDALTRLAASWRESAPTRGTILRAVRAADVLERMACELAPLRTLASVADHLDVLLAFLVRYDSKGATFDEAGLKPGTTNDGARPGADGPLRARQLRARAAIVSTLQALRDAYRRFDQAPAEFDDVAATVRRWIEGQTFAPRTGDAGVHLVDAESARFGDFDDVQIAGLVDGEWPERPRRNIFYSSGILRDLGWTAEAERLDGARAAFADLVRLPSARLRVSAFTLEDDALVSASAMLDELEAAGLDAVERAPSATRIFDYEALELGAARAIDHRFRGATEGHRSGALSLSALERYQDCPFKFFAADVLKLEETPEDEPTLSPRVRGRFIHEVFERFFEAWDRGGHGTITSDRLDAARALFEEVAAPLLGRLPEAEAALERARLFGSAIAVGIVDVVLGLEAGRPATVRERWLERRFDGEFSLGADGDRRVALKGVADRIDLLDGNRLRVIDYKSGYPPNPKRALQVPVYALCAQEMLARAGRGDWSIDDAAYVAFSGKRALVPVVKPGAADTGATLAAARERLLTVLDGIGAGEFGPRPHDPMMCRYCAYPSVCRKDYVGDDDAR